MNKIKLFFSNTLKFIGFLFALFFWPWYFNNPYDWAGVILIIFAFWGWGNYIKWIGKKMRT